MDIDNIYLAARVKAIKWLNSEKRAFRTGVDILLECKYKRTMVANLARKGETSVTREKLIYEIRQMIQLWASADDPRHEDQKEETVSTDAMVTAFIDSSDQETDNPDLKEARIKCGELFRKRGVLRNQLLEIGEKNDPESVEKRLPLIKEITELSAQIDEIYQTVKTGEPKDNELDNPDSQEETPTKEVLRKAKNNIKSKITKAKNMLEYSQEKKSDESNPLPPGPKREKYLNKIIRLEEDLQDIEYQLATFP